MNANADVVAAISNTVKLQLDEKLPALAKEDLLPPNHVPNRTSFQLGAKFGAQAKCPDAIRQELDLALQPAAGRTYLMVSTFEPRKNHAYVLDVFESFGRITPTAS